MKRIAAWHDLIGVNYLRAIKLVKEKIDTSEVDLISQSDIYISQFTKHITNTNEILILSSIPFFIVDYFGKKIFANIDFDRLLTYCEYFCV